VDQDGRLTAVDESTTMAQLGSEGKARKRAVARESTQIVGIRLPVQVAAAFKKEAAGQNVRLNELFQEMWEMYRREKRKEQTKSRD